MSEPQYESPEALGVDTDRIKRAHTLVMDSIDAENAPGAVGLVLFQKKIILHFAYGNKALIPEPVSATSNTIYDLASLSKCIGTTTASMMLLERGFLDLDQSIAAFFPEFEDKKEILIRHLLTHTSGLPAWLPIYREASDRESYRQILANTTLEYETGSKVVYSCLGYILLGLIIEKVCGEALDQFLQKELFTPLGMLDTTYNPLVKFSSEQLERVAPTELSEERGYVIYGEVHDENAYGIGGVSGNAGLFSTAFDLAKFATMLLSNGYFGGKQYLLPETIQLMTKNHTEQLNLGRGLGWVKKGPGSSGGALLTPESFGHTGFTGTSIWLDPVYDLGIILLTNQVHPKRTIGGVSGIRACFANAVVSSLPDTLLL